MHHRPSHRTGPKAIPLPSQRVLRTLGWLVGLSLLVGGLTVSLSVHAAASSASAPNTATSAPHPPVV